MVVSFLKFLEVEKKRDQLKSIINGKRSLNESWNPDLDDAPENEFGEPQKRLQPNHWVLSTIEDVLRDCQIDPDAECPRVDALHLEVVHEITNSGHFVATLFGGANGPGDWVTYLALIKKVVKKLKEEFKSVWMIDWTNDCCDDVWTLRLGLREKDDENDVLQSDEEEVEEVQPVVVTEDQKTYAAKFKDEPELDQVLAKFMTLRHRVSAPQNDIDFWIKKPFASLKSFVDNFDMRNKAQKRAANVKRKAEDAGAKLLGTSKGYEIWYIPSYEAAIQLGRFYKGRSAKWCISSEDPSFWFENHDASEFLFLVREEPIGDKLDKVAVEFTDGGRYFSRHDIVLWDLENNEEQPEFDEALVKEAWLLMHDNGETRGTWCDDNYC